MNVQFSLRQQVEAEIERLLALLDAMDGDADLEQECEDEGAQCDDEGHQESGVGDYDGLKEQVGSFLNGRWVAYGEVL